MEDSPRKDAFIVTKELSKQYDPKQVEGRTYEFWMNGGYFHAVPNSGKEPYTIVMPPPNITGQLHMGHALDNTLQDILIRWRRMQGYEALWVPGTDHASIATEVMISEKLRSEGVSKEELGREGFLERAWDWKEQYGGRIVNQLKQLGSSCDWDRERFTMDDGCSRAVREVFYRMYHKGLIYRSERIVNWCPDCMTSISNAEVEYEDVQGHFWHIRYPYADGSGYLEIATTRPETLLGDTAVAVHPDDERFKDIVGKNVILPLMDREIPVVADAYVDMDFGTGAVKITPAHGPNDFEVGERHDLPIINVMNDDATINASGGKYEGLTREEARKAVVKDLEDGGYLIKVVEHEHNVGTCYRCNTIVEPRISMQWFVKMQPLAEPAIKAVEDKDTVFVPERFEKIYTHWMTNIRDWCISRQLWWGHRIPAWYCDNCGEITVERENPEKCAFCGSKDIRQEEDVLDTWFSSALWPFSTLGWPDKTEDFEFFYPTNTLVTGYDIIFFWVARMIFSAIEQTGETPFDTVLLHGLVRAEDGRKMSKSLGNGIDPLEVIGQHGADAMRFMLATGNAPGNDMRYSEEKVISSRNFANKIWNAVRYVLMNIDSEVPANTLPDDLALEDKWILDIYNTTVKEVTENLEHFELGIAAQKVYDFTWDVLCDWYIEITKSRINQGGKAAASAQKILVYIIDGTLRMLHPFMPFITEELWQAIPHEGETIMVSSWPVATEELSFPKERKEFQIVVDAIRAIRARRSEMNVPPSKKANITIETGEPGIFAQGVPYLQSLASSDEVNILNHVDASEVEGAVQVVTGSARIFLPMDQLVDMEEEKKRLQREMDKIDKDIDMFENKLSNPGFVNNAPAHIVEQDKEKLRKAKEHKEKIIESLEAIK